MTLEREPRPWHNARRMKIAYFTAGSVGAGHVVRGLALERALQRRGFQGEYRMFGPPTEFARGPYTQVPIDHRELIDPARAGATQLAAGLRAFSPDLLVVDLFWAPLRHLLPLAGCEAWLLLRKVPPIWFTGPAGARFDPRQYARIVAIEPLVHEAIRERIDPVVICNPDECEPPGALRARLAVPAGQPVLVSMHAGLEGELAQLGAGSGARAFDLRAEGALFPLARWLGGADGIRAGAGYNTFWESRWLGYFDRMHFTPFARRIDDQAWRVRECAAVPVRENGADTLASWIRS